MDRDWPQEGEPAAEPPPGAEQQQPFETPRPEPEPEPGAAPEPDAWWPVHPPLRTEPTAAFGPTGPPAPPSPTGPPAAPVEPRRPRIGVVALVAALIGALVGGGVAGGIVAAVDNHRSTTIVESGDSSTGSRPSTVLARPGDIRSILAKVEPAVVRIDVTAQPDQINSQSGTGTGFIIDSSGIIVTNAHVANAETST